MRVIITGASSFTGFWFARALVKGGAQVTATLSRAAANYAGGHGRRLELLPTDVRRVYGAPFGSPEMLAAIREAVPLDSLCHHWSQLNFYQRVDFDVVGAVKDNTRNLADVLTALADAGCRRLVVTGTYGEPFEGVGPERERAFSPYCRSKAESFCLIREAGLRMGMAVDKFVIPNPFGPFEEPRFTTYLMRCWARGETPRVRTPAYQRDNIPVDLLARAYADFVLWRPVLPSVLQARLAPSFYVESQSDFAQRIGREVASRTGRACPVDTQPQTDFPEPAARRNPDRPDAARLGFDEVRAWDEFVAFHLTEEVGLAR